MDHNSFAYTSIVPRKSIAFLLLFTWVLAIAMLPTASGGAEIYKWQDEQGKLHFSDKPPQNLAAARDMTKTSAATMPYLKEGEREKELVFEDNTFRLILVEERPDSLIFELTYKNIDKAFPQVLDNSCTLTLSAISDQPGASYLSFTYIKVREINNTVTFENKTTPRSPANLTSSFLQLRLSQDMPGEPRNLSLFTQKIPFPKSWSR